MTKLITFPTTVNYRLVSIERDGRLTVEILATREHVVISVEAILSKPYIVRHLSKEDVKYLCDVAQLNRDEKTMGVLDSQHIDRNSK